jgi:hypothetical protein
MREEKGEQLLAQEDAVGRLLGTENLTRWRNEVQWDNLFSRGTTHISIADRAGNGQPHGFKW